MRRTILKSNNFMNLFTKEQEKRIENVIEDLGIIGIQCIPTMQKLLMDQKEKEFECLQSLLNSIRECKEKMLFIKENYVQPVMVQKPPVLIKKEKNEY